MNATFEAPLETSSIRTIADQLHIESLIVAPLAEQIVGGGNCRDHCQQHADRGKAARRSADEKSRDATDFISEAHSAPPRPYPRPARTAEERTHCGQDDSLHE